MTKSPASPGKKRRRLLWLFGAPALVLFMIGAVVAVSLKSQAESRLAKAIAAADRDDPRWRINDVLSHREKVPDSENSALVVARVLEQMPPQWPSVPWPPPGHPRPPAPPSLKAYEQVIAQPAGVRFREDFAANLRATLAERAEAVKIARTLVDYPRGRHEITLGPSVLDTPLADTQATRSVARLLQMDAMLRAHDGDLDGALDSCRAILNTGRSIGDEPFMISQLVRIAIGGVALDTARRVLALGEPSEAAIGKLQAAINDEADQPLLTCAVNGERAGMDEVIRLMSTGKISLSAFVSDLAKDDGNLDLKRPPEAKPSAWRKPWYEHQRAVMLDWMTDAVVISRKPLHDQFDDWKRWDQRITDTKKPWYGIYANTLPLLLSPALSVAFSAHARYGTMLRSTSLMLSAERHRRKTGAWPESAGAIDPAILARPLLDPYDGRPLRIKLRDGQIFVYGLGPNRRDDGGHYNDRQLYNGGAVDVGTNAWNLANRGQAPPMPELPANVFKTTPGQPSEKP